MPTTSKTPKKEVPSLNAALSELEAILEETGPEIRQLFGSALTIFAGPQSTTKSTDQKYSELEFLITRTK